MDGPSKHLGSLDAERVHGDVVAGDAALGHQERREDAQLAHQGGESVGDALPNSKAARPVVLRWEPTIRFNL